MEKLQEFEALGYTYDKRMDNLREFLRENGRIDRIARNAWLIHNHIIVYFRVLIILAGVILGEEILFFTFNENEKTSKK